MRKKIILIFGIILLFIATSGCKVKESPNTGHEDKQEESTPVTEVSNGEELNSISEDDRSGSEDPYYKYPGFVRQLKLAYEGRIDKVKAIIGENAGQYVHDGAAIDYFLGGLAIGNPDAVLLTNGYFDENDNPVHGDVVVIIKDEAYDIKTGMEMDQVKNALGEPNEIIDFAIEDGDSELYGDNTTFAYETGDYQVVIVFDSIEKTVVAIHLNGSKNNPGYPTTEDSRIDLLNLSQEELVIYDKFKATYDEEELRGLEPISVMKLYIHAGMEKDYETEWELYTKEENNLIWDKESHMSRPDSDRQKDFSEFENAVNIRNIYEDDGEYALISFEDKYLEEYDNSGYPFKFGFSLVKSKEGIWKVAYLPMQ